MSSLSQEQERFIECINTDFPALKITMSDVIKPSRQFIHHYYTTLLTEITRIPDPTRFYALNSNQIDKMRRTPGGSYMQEQVECRNLYQSVKFIMGHGKQIGESEFRFSDVFLPFLAPKRSFIFMYKMYAIYTDCCEFDEFFPVCEIIEGKKDNMAQLHQDKAALTEQIEREEQIISRNRGRLDDIGRQIAALIVDNSEKEKYIKSLESEEVELGTQLRNVESQEKVAQDEFNKLDNERQYHESLIVSDDQQVLSEHMKLSSKKEECLRKLHELEQKVAEGAAKLSQADVQLALYEALIETLGREVKVVFFLALVVGKEGRCTLSKRIKIISICPYSLS